MSARFKFGIVAAAVAAFVSAVTVGASAGVNAKPLPTLKLPTSIGVVFWAQEWMAVQQGFFKKRGINVELVNVPISGSLTLAALESGQIDLWSTGVGTLAAAAQAGHPNVFICGVANKLDRAFLIPMNSSLPTVKQVGLQAAIQALKGKRIGVSSIGGQNMQDAIAGLAAGGLTASDVQFVAVGAAATAIPALTSGQVDVLTGYGGLTQQLAALGLAKTDVFFASDIPSFKSYLNVAYAAQPAYIKAHPKEIAAFCGAIQDATQWAQKPRNQARVKAILETQFDSKTAERLVKGYFLNLLDWRISRSALTNALNVAVQQGTVQPGLTFKDLVWAKAPLSP